MLEIKITIDDSTADRLRAAAPLIAAARDALGSLLAQLGQLGQGPPQQQVGPVLDFGTVNVGAPDTLLLPGGPNPPPPGTVIDSIEITGPDAGDFTVTGVPPNFFPYTVKGDGTDPTPSITFTPSSPGPKSAQLTGTINGQVGAINPPIALVGVGQ